MKKKYLLISGLCLLNSLAFGLPHIENINIKFDDPQLISNTEIVSQPTWACRGFNNKNQTIYEYRQYSRVGNGKDLDLHYYGHYVGDNREVCSEKKINNISPYFSVREIVVSFDYDNKPYICKINQLIGLHYTNSVGLHYDTLIGEFDNELLPCDENELFEYKVVNGGKISAFKYEQGYIRIYKKE